MTKNLLDTLQRIQFQEMRKHPLGHPYLCYDELFIDLNAAIAELEQSEAKIELLQAAVKPFAQAFREGPRDQPWIETVNMTNYRDWKRAAAAGGE